MTSFQIMSVHRAGQNPVFSCSVRATQNVLPSRELFLSFPLDPHAPSLPYGQYGVHGPSRVSSIAHFFLYAI